MPSLGGLGAFDISTGLAPIDLATGANTGKRVCMSGVDSLTVVFFKEAGAAGEDPVLTLRRHDADTGGTSQDHAVVTEYWHKAETTLDGDEVWTRATQSAAATVTDATWAEVELLVAFNVKGTTLPATYKYLSVDIADTGATAGQLGAVLYIMNGVNKGAPADFPAPLRPIP
jgi:hypothetical protein